MNWDILQAKQKFSELVQAALSEPQPIYKHQQLMAFMVKADLFLEFLDWKQQKQTTTINDYSTKSSANQRQRGSAKGKIWIASDFDEPLEDFREYME